MNINRAIRGVFFLRLISILVVMLIAHANLEAQEPEGLKVTRLDQLPQNDVNCLYKDSKGFIWIGTLDGLHRFDGYTYKTYRIEDDENGISSNMIISVDEDSRGNIWIGTYGKGLCKLNPVNDCFTRYNQDDDETGWTASDDITCMMVDSRDVIWTGNWFGFNRIRFDSEMNTVADIIFLPLDTVPNRMGLIEVKTFHEDIHNTIWVGTNVSALQLLNPYSDTDCLEYNEFGYNSEVMCDMDDGILVGGQQLIKYSADTVNGILIYRDTLLHNIPSSTLVYHNNTIWLGNRAGVTFMSKRDDNWFADGHIKYTYSRQSLSSNIVTSLLIDRTDKVWIGTRGGGVSTINLNPKKIEHYKNTSEPGSLSDNYTRCIFEDRNENLWIGTEEGGVNLLRKEEGTNYSTGFKSLKVADDINGNRVYAINEMLTPRAKKHKSLIWMGTSFPTHMVAVDPESLSIKNIPDWIGHLGFVFAIEVQGDSILWVGTYGEGLWRFSVNEEGEIHKAIRLSPDEKQEYKISSYIIRSLFIDSKENLWIGTDKGLNRITSRELLLDRPKVQKFVKGEGPGNLNHDYILQVFEAQNKHIWIGTMGGGLIRFSEDSETGRWSFSSVTTKNGLPNNSVKAIQEDERGLLWLSTNNGLSSYNPANREVVNYDADDGLQDDEFSEICSFKRSNGQMIFGGINGFNVFFPGDIVKDTIKPKLFFTDFYILNRKIKPGEEINNRVVLENTIEYTRHVELKYRENSFSIGFTGLNYNAPQKHNYKYKLEGFDKQWNNASSGYRIARYTNIPSGKYAFKVLGSNSDNVWVDDPITLSITIRPPNYRSRLALIMYALLMLTAGYIVYRILQYNADRKKEVLISRIEKENIEEVSRMKMQFFTNISHEFRTPLTLINAPLEKLILKNKTLSATDRLGNYELIRHNVHIMLRLINQLMDFRKLERNKMQLEARYLEINFFVDKVYRTFIPWAERKHIKFIFKPTTDKVKLWIDPDKLEKILYNLLSNAFKFTPEKGKIELRINENPETNRVDITVKDTGIGIADSEKEKLFERYYQPGKQNKYSIGGTGIGLALAKGFVEMHKGEISFDSKPGEGSTFTVCLPVGEEHLNDKEKSKVSSRSLSNMVLDIHSIKNIDTDEEFEKETEARKYTLLIVEDNIQLLNFLSDTFDNKFKVLCADNAGQGLKMCYEQMPDIVISDVMMPVMDGLELCQKIKEDKNLSHIPVILLTAKDTESSQIKGFEAGADAYIPKPFSVEMLKANVIAVLKARIQMRMKYEKEVHVDHSSAANSPADTVFLEQIIKLIEENISDTEFNVEKLAESYGVSRIYINRKIKALTGETSNEFMRNIRLNRAAELLKQPKVTVSEVTWQIGYSDLRTFRTRFKEKFGMSPSEYAKNYKDQTE